MEDHLVKFNSFLFPDADSIVEPLNYLRSREESGSNFTYCSEGGTKRLGSFVIAK